MPLYLFLTILNSLETFSVRGFAVVSVSKLAKSGRWLARLSLLCCVMAVGGCGWSDLGRHDQDVRASWTALIAADRISVEQLDRLLAGRHVVLSSHPVNADKLTQAGIQLRRLGERPDFTLSDHGQMQQYAAARQQVAQSLKDFALALANRSNANRAWRSRSLRRQSEASVIRAQVALESYNKAARTYNRLLGSQSAGFSRALLYPGSREFALLER